MALQKQLAAIPVLGLDSNQDPKSAPLGTLVTAQDVVYKRKAQGQLEVRKRNGFTARTTNIVPSGTVSAGRKLATFNDEQLIVNSAGLFSWDPQSSKWAQRASAGMPACTLTAIPMGEQKADTANSRADFAVGGGYLCSVCGQGTNQPARVVITNLSTGVHVLDQDLAFSVTTGIREIKVVALASVFMIVASFVTTNNLVSKTIAYAAPTTVSAEVSVSTTFEILSSPDSWDMVRPGTNDWALIALLTTTPNTTIVRWNSNQTNGGTATSVDSANQGLGWLAWDASDGNMYLSYINGVNGLKTHTVTATTAAISATTVNDAALLSAGGITGYRTGTQNNIFTGHATGSGRDDFIQRSTGGASSVYQRGMNLATKAFGQGGRFYLGVSHPDAGTSLPTNGVIIDQRGFFLLDVTVTTAFTAVVVAKAFYGEGGGRLGQVTAPMGVATVDANRVAIPAIRQIAPMDMASGATQSHGPCAVYAAVVDFSIPASSPCTQASDCLYLPGGAVKEYDDLALGEAAFHLIPTFPTLSVAGAGGLTPSSTYGVCTVWVYTDNRGNIHRSAPSQAQFINLGVGQSSIAAVCPTYRITERASSVYIEVYCTAANGSVFYLVGRVANDATVNTVTYTMNAQVTAAAVPQQSQLYTTDGTLAHEPLPPARLMAAWRGRLFLAGTEDPNDIWVSDERISGEGVSFSSANIVSMERDGGPITALAEFDDKLIIFKRSSVYELVGSGPAPSGDGGFDQPSRITAVVGTVIPESVVKTSQGLMFQSLRGFYVLPIGGGQPIRLRAPEALESLAVTGAAALESVEQVRWVSSSGTTLVYHYGLQDDQGLGRWATHTGQAAVDCSVWSGVFSYLTSAGVVQAENAAYDDNGAAITAKVVFAWLSLAGLLGRHRLYRVGVLSDWLATFTATVRHAVNFDSAIVQTANLGVTASSPTPIWLVNTRGDAMAHQVTFEETSTTQGWRLSGLVLEIGAKPGAGKILIGQAFT